MKGVSENFQTYPDYQEYINDFTKADTAEISVLSDISDILELVMEGVSTLLEVELAMGQPSGISVKKYILYSNMSWGEGLNPLEIRAENLNYIDELDLDI